jgi:hypothetical protein
LPSSFNIILSSALVYSTSPPVSVWGTVYGQGYFLERKRMQDQTFKNLQKLFFRQHLPGAGILTCFPSTTTFVLALGADSLCADYPCTETLGLSAEVFFTLLYVTHVSILTSDTSKRARALSSTAYGTLRYCLLLPTAKTNPRFRYMTLAPLHFRRKST